MCLASKCKWASRRKSPLSRFTSGGGTLEKEDGTRCGRPLLAEAWSRGFELLEGFERLELLEGFERLDLRRVDRGTNTTRSVTIMVTHDALNKPTKMLSIETVDAETHTRSGRQIRSEERRVAKEC